MAKVLVGCSGWSYNHWIGKFYPSNLPRNEWLRFYTDYFRTAEVNMTFYRFPYPNMLKSWYNKTPPDFRFTFKANRLITHVKALSDVGDLVKRFLALLDLVGEKLSCVLWQLPPRMHFSPENMETLDGFLSTVGRGNNVIEFRHKSWWNKETYKLLRKHGTAFCAVSCPSLPDDFVITSDVAYIRFHGAGDWYRHNYSREEIGGWASKIRAARCKEVYCYFNNDYEAYAPKNALELVDEIVEPTK